MTNERLKSGQNHRKKYFLLYITIKSAHLLLLMYYIYGYYTSYMSKVILITGASAGLGLSIANHLAAKGYTVYGVSRNIEQGSHSFHTLKMDVGDTESIRTAVQRIISEQGRIDVLINNAGLSIAGPVENLAIADVSTILDTNVLGVLRTMQAVLPHMRARKAGHIINISSIGSENGLPFRGAYSASKAALDRLTEALRTELMPYNIQVCYVQPGGIKTDINAHRVLTQLPADNVYKDSFDRCHQVIINSIDHGLPPAIFGEKIEKILHSAQVKRCYRVGKPMEKLSVMLKGLLPARTFERMMRKYYNI